MRGDKSGFASAHTVRQTNAAATTTMTQRTAMSTMNANVKNAVATPSIYLTTFAPQLGQ